MARKLSEGDEVAGVEVLGRAALEPELVCFGHGPPLRDPSKLASFAASLPC